MRLYFRNLWIKIFYRNSRARLKKRLNDLVVEHSDHVTRLSTKGYIVPIAEFDFGAHRIKLLVCPCGTKAEILFELVHPQGVESTLLGASATLDEDIEGNPTLVYRYRYLNCSQILEAFLHKAFHPLTVDESAAVIEVNESSL